MSRRLTGAVSLALLLAAAPAAGQPGADPEPMPGADPEPMIEAAPATDATEPDQEPGEPAGEPAADDSNQELGVRAGIGLGGRVTPGGFALGGSYLYRLSEDDWFDGQVRFSFGSGAADCFRDREDALLCDHGALDGFGADIMAGVRRFFPGTGGLTPYLHGGLMLRIITFSDDEVTGVAVPVWVGAGLRARVHEGIAVGGGAVLAAGPAWLDRDLGLEPQLGLTIAASVEFVIDYRD